MTREARILVLVAMCLVPISALASGWTPAQFPVERIEGFLIGDHLRVIVVAAGEDDALEAAQAMGESVQMSKRVVSVQTMGPFSALSDADIIHSISGLVADVIVVLRIRLDADGHPEATTTYYHQQVRFPGR